VEVVLLFYSALHWVEAWLASRDVHGPSHEYRNRAMSRLREMAPILTEYGQLRTDGWNAGYNCWMRNASQVAQALRFHDGVARHVGTLLGGGRDV
jgi:hypothetical protein